MERIAAEVTAEWNTILGHAPDHSSQDFFQSRGSSLSAALLAARLSKLHGVTVPLRAVFEAPTVAGMVAWLRNNQVSPQGRIAPLSEGGTGSPLVVFPDAQGDPAELRSFSSGFRRPVVGVRSRGLSGVSEPWVSISELTADWLRVLATWSDARTVHVAGVRVGCVFAAHAAEVLSRHGWTISSVVLVNPVAAMPTRFDTALADRVIAAATSLGLPADSLPRTVESLRDTLMALGHGISDEVCDEIVARLRVAAANIVAAGSAPESAAWPQRLLISQNADNTLTTDSPVIQQALGSGATLAECIEAYLTDIEADATGTRLPEVVRQPSVR
ncbi:phosphopantetheine-binding protein [Longispora sp. NPDC051575]|uniref:phosphopantetheine-binding protein n=1 Tax=Longispora sp. NPDC051575 TaxID=3154943 RepID=UPI00341B0B10